MEMLIVIEYKNRIDRRAIVQLILIHAHKKTEQVYKQ